MVARGIPPRWAASGGLAGPKSATFGTCSSPSASLPAMRRPLVPTLPLALVLASLVGWVTVLLAPAARAEEAPLDWAPSAESPRLAAPHAADGRLYQLCGQSEVGLVKVAAALVGRRLDGRKPPGEAQLGQLLRAAGVPQVWPRAWSLAGKHDDAEVSARLRRWLAKAPVAGRPRCGIARGTDGQGEPLLVVVTVDAVADLAPVPTRTAVSRWLSLDATMLLPASDTKVVLLGPRGRPKRVLASLSGDRIRSRFNLDSPGTWLVQVVATLDDGPRPILELNIHAGVEPPATLEELSDAAEGTPMPAALFGLLNQARASEGLPALQRDPALDALARSHAAAMMRARKAAHDVGQGPPSERADVAGVKARRVAENVATAPSVGRLHRVLWNSPSHRENMLDASFGRVGVALAIDRTGQIWATQLFAD